MSSLRRSAMGVLLAAATYLLLIDTVDPPELIAGAVIVLLAGGAFALAWVEASPTFAFSLRWLRPAWRVALQIPVQIVQVSWESIVQIARRQPIRGRVRTVSFHSVGDSAVDSGRRALIELAGSLSPNTIVIGVDSEAQTLIVHQLRPGGGREQLDPLGLGVPR